MCCGEQIWGIGVRAATKRGGKLEILPAVLPTHHGRHVPQYPGVAGDSRVRLVACADQQILYPCSRRHERGSVTPASRPPIAGLLAFYSRVHWHRPTFSVLRQLPARPLLCTAVPVAPTDRRS